MEQAGPALAIDMAWMMNLLKECGGILLAVVLTVFAFWGLLNLLPLVIFGLIYFELRERKHDPHRLNARL